MRTLASVALSISVAVALLAGCGGSQPPIGTPDAMLQSSAIAMHAARGRALLYVTNAHNYDQKVTVYSYDSGKLVATLKGFTDPFGSCVDYIGNVFIADLSGKLFEYAHGGTAPIKTFDPGDEQEPDSCSVDPLTGNLAVTTNGGSTGGSVAIYRNARGTPKFYEFEREGDAYWCSYDDSGNLFVDGSAYYQYNNHFVLAELPRGGRRFKNISVSGTIESAGQVQWDGRYLAVGDNERNVINRVEVSGSQGTIHSTVSFNDVQLAGFWIHRSRIIDPEPGGGNVVYFRYPKGGASIRTITDGLDAPESVTLSIAPQ